MYSRHVEFESILNFRDLGGYRTDSGGMIAWRRLFRSGELHVMTGQDVANLRGDIGLASVIDLRGYSEIELLGIGPIHEIGIRYFNLPLDVVADAEKNEVKLTSRDFDNSGDLYLYRLKNKGYAELIIKALEIIAEPENHPLVFHCSAGKDRTGILAAVILGVLGVADEDIIEDYSLTDPHLEKFIDRWNNIPETAAILKEVPPYRQAIAPEAVAKLLSVLREEYGSVRGYLETQGADTALFGWLEKALLV